MEVKESNLQYLEFFMWMSVLVIMRFEVSVFIEEEGFSNFYILVNDILLVIVFLMYVLEEFGICVNILMDK